MNSASVFFWVVYHVTGFRNNPFSHNVNHGAYKTIRNLYEESTILSGNIDSLHTCLGLWPGIIILLGPWPFLNSLAPGKQLDFLQFSEGRDFLLADYIREYVKGECGNSALGREFYENHLILVAHYGIKLAMETGADPEIVELAAYLHDFSFVIDDMDMKQHEEKGVAIADKLLRQFNYPPDKLERVKRCILNHSSISGACGGSPEEACLANADIMSLIAKPDYWLKIFSPANQAEENSKWYYELIEKSWPLLMPSARAIMEDKYNELLKMKAPIEV